MVKLVTTSGRWGRRASEGGCATAHFDTGVISNGAPEAMHCCFQKKASPPLGLLQLIPDQELGVLELQALFECQRAAEVDGSLDCSTGLLRSRAPGMCALDRTREHLVSWQHFVDCTERESLRWSAQLTSGRATYVDGDAWRVARVRYTRTASVVADTSAKSTATAASVK
jgi:hypothetical protein